MTISDIKPKHIIEEEVEDEEEDDILTELPPPPKHYLQGTAGMRASVSAEVYRKVVDFIPPKYPKTNEQVSRIKEATSNSFLFSSFENDELKTVISAFQEFIVTKGQVVIQQGDDGDCLYLIEKGEFDCHKLLRGETTEKYLVTLRAGDSFGELALLYNCPRAATVKAKSDGILWKLDRQCFNHIVRDAATKKRDLYGGFIDKVELLQEMDTYEKSKLCDALKPQTYEDGDVVIKQGDNGDRFFIIEEGKAKAIKSGVEVKNYSAGDYFGELALLRNEPRAASIIANGPLKCVTLDRKSFKRLLGPLEAILLRNAEKYQTVLSDN